MKKAKNPVSKRASQPSSRQGKPTRQISESDLQQVSGGARYRSEKLSATKQKAAQKIYDTTTTTDLFRT